MPFVTLEDRATLDADVTPLMGQNVALVATPEGVQLRLATSAEMASAAASNGTSTGGINGNGGSAAGPASAVPPAISKATVAGTIALLDCTTSRGGAKAASCAQLDQVRCMFNAGVVLLLQSSSVFGLCWCAHFTLLLFNRWLRFTLLAWPPM